MIMIKSEFFIEKLSNVFIFIMIDGVVLRNYDAKPYVYSSRSKINKLNVLGEPLASCCFDPITGYFRNGFCHTATTDLGQHTVCAEMTSEF